MSARFRSLTSGSLVGVVVAASVGLSPSAARAQHHAHDHGAPKLETVSYIDVNAVDLDKWFAPDCKKPSAAKAPTTKPRAGTAKPVTAPAVSLVVGAASELTAQLTQPRFVNEFDVTAFGKQKRERWLPEPAYGPREETMLEVSIYPCQDSLTPAQRRSALDLVRRSYRAAKKNGWFDFATAKAQGFHLLNGGDEFHFVSDAALTDGRILDPDAPEFLMYYDVGGKKTLTGIMYLMPDVFERGPQIGGPLTLWHYHTSLATYCFKNGVMVGMPGTDGRCAVGKESVRTPEMLHVWFVPRKSGPFATDMIPPDAGETRAASADETGAVRADEASAKKTSADRARKPGATRAGKPGATRTNAHHHH